MCKYLILVQGGQYETEKEIVLKADLPGVNLADVDIRVENNTLTVRGQRQFEKAVKENNYHRVERSYGAFARPQVLGARR